jgi:3-deoxy-D-manno-octulosonic-acid transferase
VVRCVYTLLWWLALPLLPLRLWWRGRAEPGYRSHIGERFGRYAAAPAPRGPVVWIHAVSLGETRAIAPLVERLHRQSPQRTIVLTHMTATGRDEGRALFGDRVIQAWLPYDVPFAVRGFLAHFRPHAGIIAETELWPNLVAAASRRDIPMLLINARLSARSARGYRRVAALTRPMLEALAGIAAQTSADADRLRALGARDATVTGNLKFDVDVPPAQRQRGVALRAQIGATRPVVVLASTRDGEEAMLLDALARADALPTTALVIVVPRHPQRFDAVAALLDRRRIRYVRRSDAGRIDDGVRVMLGDSTGELFAYYVAADVAFVGGSLLPLGGQNLVEPIAAGVPTLIGPHTFNFEQASDAAVAGGAALRVVDADDVYATAAALLADPSARQRMRDAASSFVAAHRGAVDRLWMWLSPRLDDADRRAAAADEPGGPSRADAG